MTEIEPLLTTSVAVQTPPALPIFCPLTTTMLKASSSSAASKPFRNSLDHLMLKLFSSAVTQPFRAKFRRTLATVADPPVRRYGGLKDQDRIFTNAYCRHDHGLKGAQVCISIKS